MSNSRIPKSVKGVYLDVSLRVHAVIAGIWEKGSDLSQCRVSVPFFGGSTTRKTLSNLFRRGARKDSR